MVLQGLFPECTFSDVFVKLVETCLPVGFLDIILTSVRFDTKRVVEFRFCYHAERRCCIRRSKTQESRMKEKWEDSDRAGTWGVGLSLFSADF